MVAVVASLVGVTAVGCHDDPKPTGTSDADFYSCAEETRAIPYTKGMTLDSTGGAFALTVLDSTFPDENGIARSQAPAKGRNVWTVKITDAVTGAPLDGLSIQVTPRMPDHPNHGTLAVVVTPLGAGIYDLDPLYLWMAGLWNVKVDIQRSDAGGAAAGAGGAAGAALASDTATFPICIPG